MQRTMLQLINWLSTVDHPFGMVSAMYDAHVMDMGQALIQILILLHIMIFFRWVDIHFDGDSSIHYVVYG